MEFCETATRNYEIQLTFSTHLPFVTLKEFTLLLSLVTHGSDDMSFSARQTKQIAHIFSHFVFDCILWLATAVK